MKILLVTNSLGSGGKERQIIELSKVLLDKTIDFKVICFSTENNIEGIELIKNRLCVINKKEGLKVTQKKFLAEINKFKPTIVHVWDNKSALFSILPKCLNKFKLVDGSIRGAKRYLKRIVYMAITYPFTDKVVANSLAGLKSTFRNTNKRNVVVYNGFDLIRISKPDESFNVKEKFGITDKKIVGMIANIRAAKDYSGFVKVAELVIKKRSDIVFMSIGSGEIDKVLMSKISPEIKSQIIFMGHIGNTADYLKSFDIGLLMNDTKHGMEGISNAILEYMAFNLPVIATDAGGSSEVVYDTDTGFLVPAYDYDSIAEKILYLIYNEERRMQMGVKGKEILVKQFSISRMGEAYINLYTDLAN